ncbi:MAG: LysM peptidoglycan-binding domain-containing protein [Flavobacteriales bacterium]
MMRRFLLGLLLCLGMAASAQEMRTVNGQKYIAHTVAQGQTLFAISRHYAVPVEAITQANPGADQGLSIGQVLLIPQSAQVKKDLKAAPALRDGELAHTVAKKETLFGIARKYGVDQQDLLTRNPELTNGVREGMTVIIPTAKVLNVAPAVVKPAEADGSQAHLVAAGETLFSLGKQYGTTVEAIQAANGGLPEGLKVGMYIRIPAPPKAVEPAEPVEPAKPAPGALFKVAYLLPFSIAANDSVRARDGGEHGYHTVTNAAVQFYAGAQLALDSLKAQGLRVDVQVFDVGGTPATWIPVTKSDAIRGMDLYIGPFHRNAIEALTRVSGDAHIVCPVPQSNKVILGNPGVSKVLSGRPDQLQQMARYIAYHHGRDNIILCKPVIPAEKEVQDQMARALQAALSNQRDRLRDSVSVVAPERRNAGMVLGKLSASQRNIVVVPSEDVEFVTSLVTKLAGQVGKFRIEVFGLNSWLAMDNLEVTDLVKLGTHIPASTFVDYDDPQVKAFVGRYRDRFQNEPGDYAFLGYDVTMFYVTALMGYGRGFPAHFTEVGTHPLHMAFRFQKAGGPENGYRNENAVMLEYTSAGLKLAR